MRMYIGITDYDWFKTLQQSACDEINFWKPGGKTTFRAISEGDLFLFKLHSPQDFIVGGGFFLKFSILPSTLAWEAFGIANGTDSLAGLQSQIYKYKKTNRLSDPDPNIGCVILTMPFYFDDNDWLPVPQDWSNSIVQGKTYDTSSAIGLTLYENILERLKIGHKDLNRNLGTEERYGAELIIKPRLGQGSFKIFIADAYQRRCAITGEKTLPVLEAAHIKPYSLEGPHEVSNGLLLRKDFHTLFDRGYITINKALIVEVSHRIKDDFGNGKEYYVHHGQNLLVLPERADQLPSPHYLEWHNENVYLG